MERSERKKKVMDALLSMQRWPWEQGVASQSLLECGEEDLVVLFAEDAVVNQLKDGRLGMKYDQRAATDPASNGESVLFAYKKTGNERFKKAFDRMTDYILYRIPRTRDGIMFHNENEGQIFSDATFMIGPFLVLAGHPEEAIKQVRGFWKYLMNTGKGLLAHIWDDDNKAFRRDALWGVGNGWNAAGIARMIRFMPDSMTEGKKELAGMVKSLIDAALVFQRSDGLFHDVVDDPSTFVETNLAQMLSYAIYCGVREGWLDKSFIPNADKMREAVYKKVDFLGLVQGVCGAPHFDHSGIAAEGQSFYLFMESAYDKWLGK
jgi:rhamnogalacturonyl hydrolase YesR